MRKVNIVLLTLVAISMSFTNGKNEIEFDYPKNKDAGFIMTTDKFKKFRKEWRGQDYYYLSENGENGMICSVLFYKLNNDEQTMLVDMPRSVMGLPEVCAAYPLTYFTTNSNLKPFETNMTKWGDPSEDFMYSQSDIKEFNGMKVNQKHMNAYAMFDKDLFVNIHLSKTECTQEDSIAMRQILEGLKKNNKSK